MHHLTSKTVFEILNQLCVFIEYIHNQTES